MFCRKDAERRRRRRADDFFDTASVTSRYRRLPPPNLLYATVVHNKVVCHDKEYSYGGMAHSIFMRTGSAGDGK